MNSMRPVAIGDLVAWCVSLFVTRLRSAITAKRIKVLFGEDTLERKILLIVKMRILIFRLIRQMAAHSMRPSPDYFSHLFKFRFLTFETLTYSNLILV